MTIDKFNHYLGTNLVAFICSLNTTQLAKLKDELIKDLPFHANGSESLFKRNVELKLINSRL